MNATTPGLLTPDVLNREDLRSALADHDFAAAFALIKKWGGLSQSKIAFACELTPGKVSLIIHGRHQVSSIGVIRRISDGLGIPGNMLGLAPRPWEESKLEKSNTYLPEATFRPDATPWCTTATGIMADELTRSDLVMDRRAMTRALTSAAVTGTALLESLEGWQGEAVVETRQRAPGRVGSSEVFELEETARTFRTWAHKHGGSFRRKAVVGLLNEVASAVSQRQSSGIEKRLYGVMAQLSGTAATMFWDIGAQRRAQDYYKLALRASRAGEDYAFGANVLAGMARQMLYCDRPDDARELVRLAQDGSRGVAGPRVRAMLHTREAWAYAHMGRHGAFRRATERAESELEDADEKENDPYWIRYFDAAELAGVTGGRLLDMARKEPSVYAEHASEYIRNAIVNRGQDAGRGTALDRIGLAECRFLVGDLTEAVNKTQEAVKAAQRTESQHVRRQLAQLYPYTVGTGASRPIAEARESIRSLLSSGGNETA